MDPPLVLLLAACITSSYASSSSEPWFDPRLPRSLSPTHYALFIQPYTNEVNFYGTVSIQMNVLNQTNFIVVHAEDLNITRTNVFVNTTTSLNVIRAFGYELNKYWVVETAEGMVPGDTVKLDLEFMGRLTIYVGLVKSTYKNKDTGDDSPIVITRFHPNYARLAFPNFDEPFFKSQFTVTLRHWANLTAVSNTPEQSVTTIDSDWRETTFGTTLVMNSFAVSFVISNMAYRNSTFEHKLQYRAWARPDLLDGLDYALDVTSILLDFYITEIGHARFFRKLDHFAVPFFLYPGGNPTVGLISQDEEQLTFNSTRDGDQRRLSNLVVIAFELARIYFSNLVTCREWDHLWLESGLAFLYSLKAAAVAEPIKFFEQSIKERSLHNDAFNNSRPLVLPASNDTENPDIYHLLPIAKGSAVLKMLEDILGYNTFQRGVRIYIYRNLFKTVLTQDLFNAFQTVAGASTNITEIMNTWVYSMGYPVINIQLLADNKINATQKRFLMDPLADPNSPSSTHGYKWYVPLNYRTKGGQTGRVWLNKTDAVFENLLTAEDNWILFNYNQFGYYRVNYEATLWNNIATQLESDHMVFTDLQRSQLLSDALTLAQAEQLGFEVALKLTMFAWKERSLLSWTFIHAALENIGLMLANTSDFARFQKYVLNLTTNAMNELTVSDEGTLEQKLLRQKIMPLSCSAGHTACIENTTRLFKAWIQDDKLNVIPVNIRRIVYCSAIANSANEGEWNTTFNRFVAETVYDKKDELRLSLACTKNLTLLDRYLERCLSNGTADIKRLWFKDLSIAAKEFSRNPDARYRIWEWLKAKHAEIDARFYRGASAYLVPEVAYNFNTEAQLTEVQRFFARMNTSTLLGRPKEQTEDKIKANIRWMNNLYAAVSSWLLQNFSTPTEE